jgi:hypothetical protein
MFRLVWGHHQVHFIVSYEASYALYNCSIKHHSSIEEHYVGFEVLKAVIIKNAVF